LSRLKYWLGCTRGIPKKWAAGVGWLGDKLAMSIATCTQFTSNENDSQQGGADFCPLGEISAESAFLVLFQCFSVQLADLTL
jgi:hypothetical protein